MESNRELLELLQNRRSCRAFQPQPLDRDTLSAIVEAGRRAPSAMNRQLCRFYVLTDPDLLEAVSRTVSVQLEGFAGRDCRYGAPALVLVTNRRDNACALQDASCAMENMMLAAAALGVGSCWINQPYYLSGDETFRALLAPIGLTGEEAVCASLALGLPAGELFPGLREIFGNPVVWAAGDAG